MPRHPASLPIEELLRQCTERHVRRSGPGGQHRNKVETGVVLTHLPTGLLAEASERRSQSQNRAVALGRMRRLLALEVRSPLDAAEPSLLWQSRLKGGRISVSDEHVDHSTLLAEALDWLAALDWDVSVTADRLGTTTSQLIKLLKSEPRAMKRLNDERAARGLLPLK